MAATTARKATAKKPAARSAPRVVKAHPAAAVLEPDDDPIVLEADRPAEDVDVFPIFKIGDTQYYAPARPHARVELTYLYTVRHDGPDAANGYLLEELVGHDGFVALMNYQGLTRDDLDRIFGLLQESLQGAAAAMSGPKGKLKIG